MNINRKYKDSVFSFIFSNPDTLRELYSALKGITLPADVPITINTLKNVLFMEKINDISFLVDDRLIVLIEHQRRTLQLAVRFFMTKWNWDDAKEVWQEEAREEGLEMGLLKGREEIARNALAEGFSVKMIEKITGLTPETIENIKLYK